MKASPVFWPEPAKPKPATVKTPSTVPCSVLAKCFWMRSITSSVRPNVAPGGSCTRVKAEPWSSSGRKPVGSLTNRNAMTRTRAP